MAVVYLGIMSETDRLGGTRLPRVGIFVAVITAAVLLLLGTSVLLWPRRPPAPRYTARLAALQWIREPKKSGSQVALCIRVTRRDGGRVASEEVAVEVPDSIRLGFQSTGAFAQYFPNRNDPRTLDLMFVYRPPAGGLPTTSLDAQLQERTPVDPWTQRLKNLTWQEPEIIARRVDRMPAVIPPMPPRARQVDLTTFIVARKGRSR